MIARIPEDKIGESEFYRKYWNWMSEEQWECVKLLCLWVGGFHHMPGKPKEWGRGIECNFRPGNWMSTYDFNNLTRLVLLAHKHCTRVDILGSGPGMIKLCLWKRERVEGGRMSERHPDLGGLIEMCQKGIDN